MADEDLADARNVLAAGFALAGGAALIVRGTVDRRTNDLDFLIGHADVDAGTISTMVAAVERALGEAGIGSQREVVSDTFARLTAGGDRA